MSRSLKKGPYINVKLEKKAILLAPCQKYSNVTHAIHSLEHPFLHRIFVGNMTVIARSIPAMRTMELGCIIRSHDMTVDTGSRIIGQIGMCPKHIKGQSPSTYNHTCYNDRKYSPLTRRE